MTEEANLAEPDPAAINLDEEFAEVAALINEYGRRWWEFDAEVQDLCLREHGMLDRLRAAQTRAGVVSTSDVHANGALRWPDHWRDQRVTLHHGLLEQLKDRKRPKGPVAGGPLAYVVLGIPGSGKTTALRPIVYEHYRKQLNRADRTGAPIPVGLGVLDADEVRMLFPEYSDGLGSLILNEECSTLTYGPRRVHLSSGGYPGLLIDTVGDPILLPRTVADLTAAGYRVHLLLATVDVETAITRAKRRCVEQGRMVGIGYLRSKVGVPEAALQLVVDSGVPLAGWGIWNTSGRVPTHTGGQGAFAPS